ncbi:MAG: hypothetical protein QQN46_07640 [Nitrosopumilus sp.]
MVKEQNSKPRVRKDIGFKTGVILLNTCTNCGSEFKPINSMIYETLCDLCQKKTKSN